MTISSPTRTSRRPRLAAALLACLWSASAAAVELRGPAEAIDSDTLVVSGETVRLLDVDAVELSQTCEGPRS